MSVYPQKKHESTVPTSVLDHPRVDAAAGATSGIVVLLAYSAVVPSNRVRNHTYFSCLKRDLSFI